jgi:hypothetical protein
VASKPQFAIIFIKEGGKQDPQPGAKIQKIVFFQCFDGICRAHARLSIVNHDIRPLNRVWQAARAPPAVGVGCRRPLAANTPTEPVDPVHY